MRAPRTALVVAAALVAACGGPDRASELQASLDRAVDELHISGASVAVITDTGSWAFASGDAHVEGRFGLASITKTYTATLALLLAERGEVDLDAPAGLTGLDADVTLRDLLGHTAGLPYPGYLLVPWTDTRFASWTRRPGGCERPCFQYSDLGFIGAGLVLERETGEPYDALLRQHLLGPLRLRDTVFASRDGTVDYATAPVGTWSAGAMFATAMDLARFGRSLLTGEILRPASLDEMLDTDPSIDLPCAERCFRPYGLGILRLDVGGRDAWVHDGSTGAVFAHFPADGLTVAIVTRDRASGGAVLSHMLDDLVTAAGTAARAP